METAVKKLYEAMFLVDPVQASDWDAVTGTLKTTLERAEAEIVSMEKWDERKLAYKISGKTRGTYVLCYFKADGEKIRNIEKAAKLSEQIIRVLILSAETREKENVERASISTDSHSREAWDDSVPAKTEDETIETDSPQEDNKMEIQEDIPFAEVEKEKYEATEESVQETSTQQQTEQAGEPEHSDEPAASDASEPEQLEQSETEKDFWAD